MDIKKIIVDLFDTHPKVDTFYMTSDGQFFEVKSNADFQSQRLPKKGVATVTRAQSDTFKAEFAVAAGAAMAHPEASTILTQEQLDAKAADDQSAQEILNAKLGAVAAEPVAPAVDQAAPAADAIQADAPAADTSKTKTKAAAPVADQNAAQ